MDGSGLPTGYVSLSTKQKTLNIVSTTSFLLQFSRFLLPTTTFRQSVCVQPSTDKVLSLNDCKQPVFLEPTYDPVHQQITYRQPADPASLHLVSGGTYKLTVFPPPSDDSSFGVRAFDGAPLDQVSSYEFQVLDADPPGARVEPLPSQDLCLPVAQKLSGCASPGCHVSGGPKDHGVLLGPAEGLDLSSAEAIARTAIGHVAHETQEGEHASQGEVSPPRFGRAMPILDPTRPGNSYLLYKLLANAANTHAPSDAEQQRLRDALVVGMPMPPSTKPSALFTDADLEDLSTWILEGAPANPCK